MPYSVSTGPHWTDRPIYGSMSQLGQEYVAIRMDEYLQCFDFLTRHERQIDFNDRQILADAAKALAGNDRALARRCVQQALLLRRWMQSRGPQRKKLFQDLENGLDDSLRPFMRDFDKVMKEVEGSSGGSGLVSRVLPQPSQTRQDSVIRQHTSRHASFGRDGDTSDRMERMRLEDRGISQSVAQDGPRHLTLRDSSALSSDQAFQAIPIHHWENYFRHGRVFAILTYMEDPRDTRETREQTSDQSSVRVTRDRWGNSIYSTVRRMVVVGQGKGFCWTVPISTYGSRGLSKPGLNATNIQAHAIIHMDDKRAQRLPNEPQSSKRPIAVHAEDSNQVLHPASRVNFERVHTVEMNVRILKVGTVTDSSLPFLKDYFRQEMQRVSSSNS